MKKSSNEKQSFENKNVKAIVGYHSEDNIEHPDINKDEIKKPEPSLEETISIIKKLLLKIDYDDGEMAVKYIDVVFDTDGYCIISYKKTDTETEEKPQVKYGLEWEKETVEKKYAKGVPLPKISKNISSKFRLVDVKTCILLTNQIYFNCHEHIKDFINQKRGKIEVFPTDNAYSYVEIKGKFISKMTNEFIIHINNRTTAERLQQAFLHAIKLAKSNKQKNEWFD